MYRLLLAALVGLFAPSAFAQTCTTSWTNPSGGMWEANTNWSAGAPDPGDTVCITLPGTYTVSSNGTNKTVGGLVVGGASGTQTLTTFSEFSVTGNATVHANGRWEFQNRVPGGSDGLYMTATLSVEGTVEVPAGVTFLANGGTLDVAPGGTLRVIGNGAGAGGPAALFRIRGTLEAAGCPATTSAGNCQVSAPIEVVGGTVRAAGGVFFVRGSGTVAGGTLDAAAGASLYLSDEAISGGAPLVLTGTVSGAPAGLVYASGVNVAAGAGGTTLAVGGTGFQLTGSAFLTSAGGELRNTGLLVHAATVSNFATIDGATLRNEGRFWMPGTGFGFRNGAVVRNEASGTIEIANRGGLGGVGGSDGSVENAGLILANGSPVGPGSGATAGTIGVPYSGEAGSVLRTETGRLDLTAGGTLDAVTVDVPEGTELWFAGGLPYVVTGTLSGTPAGTLYANGADFAAGPGGATLAVGGTGFQLTGSATLTSAGGAWTNTGLLVHPPTGSNFASIEAATLRNAGRFLIDRSGFGFRDGGVVRNEPGGVVELSGGGAGIGGVGGTVGRFENAGLLWRTGGDGSSNLNGLLFSEPGSEIRSDANRLDLTGPGAQSVPEGVTLTGAGRFGVPRELDFQGSISPGTAEQPLARLEFESAYMPSQVAGHPRLVTDVEAGGRSDTLHILTTFGGPNVRLGGTLVVRVRPGYVPEVGDTFTVLTSARAIEGAFGEVVAENASGAVFAAATAPDGLSVVLTVTQGVGSEDTPPGTPEALAFGVVTLSNPSPHPSVRVTLAEAMALAVEVYDVRGRRVAVLAEGERAGGMHALPVSGLAPGLYVARVVAVGPSGTERATQRFVVAR